MPAPHPVRLAISVSKKTLIEYRRPLMHSITSPSSIRDEGLIAELALETPQNAREYVTPIGAAEPYERRQPAAREELHSAGTGQS